MEEEIGMRRGGNGSRKEAVQLTEDSTKDDDRKKGFLILLTNLKSIVLPTIVEDI